MAKVKQEEHPYTPAGLKAWARKKAREGRAADTKRALATLRSLKREWDLLNWDRSELRETLLTSEFWGVKGYVQMGVDALVRELMECKITDPDDLDHGDYPKTVEEHEAYWSQER